MSCCHKPVRGFSLIELVTVIVLLGIIAVVIGRVLSRPLQGFVDLSQRSELVDIAELTLRRMSREVRLALPNSVRLTNGVLQNMTSCTATGGTACAVEILRTAEGGRYRAKTAGGAGVGVCGGSLAQDRLSFTTDNDCFEILGTLLISPAFAGGATQDECLDGTVDCLVIYNTGQAGANAYNADNIAGIRSAAANTITFDISGAAGVTRFPLQSARQRFHIVDMPVSFTCDTAAGIITRQADYTIAPAQLANPGGSSALLANRISSCVFTYNPGTGSRNGLLTVAITLGVTDTQGGVNTVSLLEQVQVPNIP